MPVAEMSMNPSGLLLQTSRGRAPHALEMYLRSDGPSEHHFYAQGLTLADFAALYGADLRPLEVLIFKMPPDLLNPNYWEPLTKEGENAVREKLTGIITRADGDRTLLWRADRVARSRMLRDGVDVPVELLSGYVFRTSGEGLLKLGQAWNGRGRLEWTALALPAGSELPPETLAVCHSDLAQVRRTLPEEIVLYSTQDDDATRIVFSRRDHLRRGITALLRGFVHGATHTHLAPINDAVCSQIAELADGVGFSADPDRDVLDKGRTVEVAAYLGRTPWGVQLPPGHPPLSGDEKILIYYDRISGLWAVSN